MNLSLVRRCLFAAYSVSNVVLLLTCGTITCSTMSRSDVPSSSSEEEAVASDDEGAVMESEESVSSAASGIGVGGGAFRARIFMAE